MIPAKNSCKTHRTVESGYRGEEPVRLSDRFDKELIGHEESKGEVRYKSPAQDEYFRAAIVRDPAQKLLSAFHTIDGWEARRGSPEFGAPNHLPYLPSLRGRKWAGGNTVSPIITLPFSAQSGAPTARSFGTRVTRDS